MSFLNLPANGAGSWKHSAPNAGVLPLTGNTIGDTRVTLDTLTVYVWDGTSWQAVATPGAAIAIDGLIGDVSATGPGVVNATVNSVGGASAGTIAGAVASVNSGAFLKVDGTNSLTANMNAGGFRLTNLADPLNPQDAATKNYVTTFTNTTFAPISEPLSLHINGSNSPTADINWGGFKITNLAAPIAGGDAANKTYIDTTSAPISEPLSLHLNGNNSPSAAINWNNQNLTSIANLRSHALRVGNSTLNIFAEFENGIAKIGEENNVIASLGSNYGAGFYSFIQKNVPNASGGYLQLRNAVDNSLITMEMFRLDTFATEVVMSWDLVSHLVNMPYLSASKVVVTDASKNLASSSMDASFLDATSSIQTQLNGKQATGNYITDLTGDATATGPGSAVLTLATVNGNVGTFGTVTNVSTITVNAKGLITAASNTPIQITESQVTGLLSDLASKQSTISFAPVGAVPNANGAIISGGVITLEPFDSTNPGVVPLSGGGTTNFLRADGTWAAAGVTFPLYAPNGSAALPSYSFINKTGSGLTLVNDQGDLVPHIVVDGKAVLQVGVAAEGIVGGQTVTVGDGTASAFLFIRANDTGAGSGRSSALIHGNYAATNFYTSGMLYDEDLGNSGNNYAIVKNAITFNHNGSGLNNRLHIHATTKDVSIYGKLLLRSVESNPNAKLSIGINGTLAVNATIPFNIPAVQGAATTNLQNDGSGNLSWVAAPAAGANVFLSNLSSPTAINQQLLAPNGSRTAPSYSFTSTPNAGMFFNTGTTLNVTSITGEDSLEMGTNGAAGHFQVAGSGYGGIGQLLQFVKSSGSGPDLILRQAAGSTQTGIILSQTTYSRSTIGPSWALYSYVASDPFFSLDVITTNSELLSAGSPRFQVYKSGNVLTFGDVIVTTQGNGLRIKEDPASPTSFNAKMGIFTLSTTGITVVPNTTVTANSRIFMTVQAVSGTPVLAPAVGSRIPGTSFTVLTTSGDTSTVAFMIVEPA